MNKVVVRQVAGSVLPTELLGDIDPSHIVEVTVRDLERTEPRASTHLSDLVGTARGVYGTTDEILRHISALRADRDR